MTMISGRRKFYGSDRMFNLPEYIVQASVRRRMMQQQQNTDTSNDDDDDTDHELNKRDVGHLGKRSVVSAGTSLESMTAVVVEKTVSLVLALTVVDSAEMIPTCGSLTGSHSNPLPTYPTRQVQKKLPNVLVHSA